MISAGVAMASLTVSPFRRSGWASSCEVLGALLLGDRDAFGRRAEPPQQGVDGQRDDAEHGDLAEGVEAAEVDQDDVHDVGAAALRIGVLDEEAARCCRAPGGSSPRRRAPPIRPRGDRDGEVADAIPSDAARAYGSGAELLDALGEPAQAEQEQHRGHGLDDKLRQREIGRRQPHEADAGDEARAAEQDQRRQAMELGLVGGAERAGDPDGPDQREGEVEVARRRARDRETRARKAAPGRR